MQISFTVLTPLLTPKPPRGRGDTGGGDPHRRGRGGYGTPYCMGGLGKVQMGPPSVYSHVWESCQDNLISKYIRGNLSTDNMTIVEKYWGKCLVN